MPAAARTPGRRASAPAVPAGSGAPSAPTTTRSAVTRASVTRSVSSCELACSTPWVPTSMAISTTGVASAAVRQRLAARPVLASRPGAPRSRSGSDSAAAGRPSSQRPSMAVPLASRMPPRIENASAASPVKIDRHRDATAQAEHAAEQLEHAGTPVLDRNFAQRLGRADAAGAARGGDHGELGDPDAGADGGGQRDQRAPEREALGRDPAIDEQLDDGQRKRAAGQDAEGGGGQRDDQRLAGDQPAHLAGRRAERAQDRGLAPALGDREREGAGHDEQRHGAGDPGHRAEDRHQGFAVGGGGVAGVGRGGVRGVEHLDALAHPPAQLGGRCADDADRVDAGRAGQRPGDGRSEEQGDLVRRAGGDAADPIRRVAAGRDDAHGVAGAHAEPRVDHDVARAARAPARR